MQRTSGQDGFPLTVTIPAQELAELQRRVVYFEAVVMKLLREHCRVQEWFTAADLESLRLPGLPAHRNVITRKAGAEGWRRRKAASGRGYEYHFSSLPRRAFEELVDRVMKPFVAEAVETGEMPDTLPGIPPAEPRPDPGNLPPVWALPLMRLVKDQGPITVREAVERLALVIDPETSMPTIAEAADYLRRLGWVDG